MSLQIDNGFRAVQAAVKAGTKATSERPNDHHKEAP
jgi:hypothetical protein